MRLTSALSSLLRKATVHSTFTAQPITIKTDLTSPSMPPTPTASPADSTSQLISFNVVWDSRMQRWISYRDGKWIIWEQVREINPKRYRLAKSESGMKHSSEVHDSTDSDTSTTEASTTTPSPGIDLDTLEVISQYRFPKILDFVMPMDTNSEQIPVTVTPTTPSISTHGDSQVYSDPIRLASQPSSARESLMHCSSPNTELTQSQRTAELEVWKKLAVAAYHYTSLSEQIKMMLEMTPGQQSILLQILREG